MPDASERIDREWLVTLMDNAPCAKGGWEYKGGTSLMCIHEDGSVTIFNKNDCGEWEDTDGTSSDARWIVDLFNQDDTVRFALVPMANVADLFANYEVSNA